MEDGVLWGKTETKFIKLRTIGWGGRNIDAVSLRQPPRKSVDVRGICGRKMEDGSWGIMRKTEAYWPERKKPGRGGGYCSRQLPSASAVVSGHPRHVWAEDGRWKMGNYEEKRRKMA